jgi:hypothetical protein
LQVDDCYHPSENEEIGHQQEGQQEETGAGRQANDQLLGPA